MDQDTDYLVKVLGDYRPIQTAISLLIFNAIIMNTTSLLLFMCSRRKLQPLKIRSMSMVSLTLLSQSIWVVVLAIFNILGENNVACFLQRISHYLTLPLIVVPYILRSLRMVFVFRLNQAKSRLQKHNAKVDNDGIIQSQFENTSTPLTNPQSIPEEPPKKKKSNFLGLQEEEEEEQPKKKKLKKNVNVMNQIDSKVDAITASLSQISTISRLTKLILKTPFLLGILFFSLVIVAGAGIGGEILFDSKQALEFKESCAVDHYLFSYFSEIFIMLYMCINVVLLVCCVVLIRGVKEQFGLVSQMKVTAINYILMCLSICTWFVVPNATFRLTVPFVWVIFPFLLFDSIIGGWIPTLNTLKSSYGFHWGLEVPDTSSLADILNHEKSRSYFYMYTQREFSTENVHFWLDCQYYLSLYNKDDMLPAHLKDRAASVATTMVQLYFTSNSPMELNIPQSVRKSYLSDVVQKDGSKLNPTVITVRYFDTVLQLIEHNMMDTYSRFIHNALFQEMIQALTEMNVRAKELGMF